MDSLKKAGFKEMSEGVYSDGFIKIIVDKNRRSFLVYGNGDALRKSRLRELANLILGEVKEGGQV